MLIPLPSRPRAGVPRDPVAFYSERLDADHERFDAASRRATRRFGIYAVLGAALVVGVGIWGFGKETNTRNVPIRSVPIRSGPIRSGPIHGAAAQPAGGPAGGPAAPRQPTAMPGSTVPGSTVPGSTVMVVIKPG